MLDVREGYLFAVGLNIALLAILAVLLGFVVRWKMPLAPLLILGVLAFAPVYFTLEHAQPTIFMAALLAGGYMALRAGRPLIAGLLMALTGVKPHWLLVPATLLRKRELWLPFLGACVVIIALPFLLLGPATIVDYVRLILDRGDGDLTDSTYATRLLSWSGFFQAWRGEPQPVLWLIASIATLGLYGRIWLRSNTAVTLAAAVPTFLLIVPHSHPQDWTLMVVSAALLLSLRWSPLALAGIAFTLLAVLAGADEWRGAVNEVGRGETQFYWVSLAAFSLLAWLAVLTWWREDAAMMGRDDFVVQQDEKEAVPA